MGRCWAVKEGDEMRRRFSVVLAAIIGFVALVVVAPSASAQGGPQPLPDAACNAGTANAHGHIPAGVHEQVAHLHDFDNDTIFGCYHGNPVNFEPGE